MEILKNKAEGDSKWFGVDVVNGRVTNLDWSGAKIEEKRLEMSMAENKNGEGKQGVNGANPDQNDEKKNSTAKNEQVKRGNNVAGSSAAESKKPQDDNKASQDSNTLGEEEGEEERKKCDKLSGCIPSAIAKLDALKNLDLSGNSLSGSVPEDIGDLVGLINLHLEGNSLDGKIPDSLGTLANLKELYLQKNKLEGGIEQIAGCRKISIIYLQGNEDLSNQKPDEFKKLSYLNLMHLNGGDLEIMGKLGEDARVLKSFWEKLGGSDDDLTGGAGDDIFKWKNIKIMRGRVTEINWSDKELTGVIYSNIGNLTELKHLDLSQNSLSGWIPKEIEGLEKLTVCNLSENYLSQLPEAIGNCSKLVELRLNKNELSGIIPASIGKLSNLKHLFLNNNKFDGAVPSALGELKNLVELHLNNNVLEGKAEDILETIKSCDKLLNIYLHETFVIDVEIKLDGKISGLPMLRWLHLPKQGLQARGQLGDDAKNVMRIWKKLNGKEESLKCGSDNNVAEWANVRVEEGRVTELNWSKQDLYGVIPNDYIGKLKELKVLNLGQNKQEVKDHEGQAVTNSITGEIPEAIGFLGKLTHLNLQGNELVGPIPVVLKHCTGLEELYLDNNKLGGEFPEDLGDLQNIKVLHVHGNKLRGSIPAELDRNPELDLNSLKYYDNEDLKAPIRQGPIDKDKSALWQCWKAMGGDLGVEEQEKRWKDILHNGEPKDHSKWKGVHIEGFRVTAIGKCQRPSKASSWRGARRPRSVATNLS